MKTKLKSELIRFGIISVWINIFGIIFSGLVFPVLSLLICPQPVWETPELFIKSYNPLQTLTFFSGFFLVLSALFTFVILFLLSKEKRRVWALTGLIINTLFTSIVFLNYIIQTTYVPYLATNNPSETSFILAVLSMANPGSLAWALEMYGWGGIGLSYVFMAMIFKKANYKEPLKYLFILNGIISVSGAIITSMNMNWLFSMAGMISLIVWNSLVLTIDIYLLYYFKNKTK